MSITSYQSPVSAVPYAQSSVYAKLSDLTSIKTFQEYLSEQAQPEQAIMGIDAEKVKKIKESLQGMTYTADSIQLSTPVGQLMLRITQRIPQEHIVFTAEDSPIPLTLHIDIQPTEVNSCSLQVTAEAELNMFIKGMVHKPLTQGIAQIATLLASLPYNA